MFLVLNTEESNIHYREPHFAVLIRKNTQLNNNFYACREQQRLIYDIFGTSLQQKTGPKTCQFTGHIDSRVN